MTVAIADVPVERHLLSHLTSAMNVKAAGSRGGTTIHAQRFKGFNHQARQTGKTN
jgi:hypothetical protein